MSRRRWLLAWALAAVMLGVPSVAWADRADRPAETPASIGVIQAPSFAVAKAQALAWLQATRPSADVLRQAEALWKPAADRTIMERVAETLALGDSEARKLLASARDLNAPAPTAVPDLLKDAKRPVFYRANLALYYAKLLTNRRVYEQALEALLAVRPEHVADPASYYFYKAVCESRLENRQAALASLDRLLRSVPDAPERYVVTANLMKAEIAKWKDKGASIPDDLKWAARRMENIAERLEIARGGQKTQAMQKEVIDLLDDIIKKLDGT